MYGMKFVDGGKLFGKSINSVRRVIKDEMSYIKRSPVYNEIPYLLIFGVSLLKIAKMHLLTSPYLPACPSTFYRESLMYFHKI
jgi:hypothetical protein